MPQSKKSVATEILLFDFEFFIGVRLENHQKLEAYPIHRRVSANRSMRDVEPVVYLDRTRL
jgi:hypothetical protein